MSVTDVARFWGELPKDVQQQITSSVLRLWSVRSPLLWQVLAWVAAQVGAGAPIQLAVRKAGPRFGLSPRWVVSTPAGMSAGQVRQYGRRQEERGRRPGKDPRWRARHEAEAFEHELGVRPRVAAICREASGLASELRAYRLRAGGDPRAMSRLRSRANGWVKQRGADMLSGRHSLRREEIDLLVGCLARVEHAVGAPLPAMNGIRARAERMLEVLGRR
jgi:hypothetical protein